MGNVNQTEVKEQKVIHLGFKGDVRLLKEESWEHNYYIVTLFMKELVKCETCGDALRERLKRGVGGSDAFFVDYCPVCSEHVLQTLCTKKIEDGTRFIFGQVYNERLNNNYFDKKRRLREAKPAEIDSDVLPNDMIQLIIMALIEEKEETCGNHQKSEYHRHHNKIALLCTNYSKFLCVSKAFTESFLYYYRLDKPYEDEGPPT